MKRVVLIGASVGGLVAAAALGWTATLPGKIATGIIALIASLKELK